MRAVGAEGCHYTDKSLSKEERLIIVDQCLEFNYKCIVPLIADGKIKGDIKKVKQSKLKTF
jgi:hypothetical protein